MATAKRDEPADTDDLQALFDSIANPASEKPKLEVVAKKADSGNSTSNDSDELEDLFDSVAAQSQTKSQSNDDGGVASQEEKQEAVFNRIGQMTRELHDTLHQFGYDRMLEETARQIPDARQRLSYISQMTEQAASRVLNATDIAKPVQDRVEKNAGELKQRWEKLYGNELSVEDFKQLAGDTRGFLNQVTDDSKVVNEQLLEIMMAQDFQDLTGQVIKKIVDMAQHLESELLKVLIEVIPDAKKKPAVVEGDGLLNGPVISAAGRDDVVTNQEQVDDLLESLGF